MKPSIKYNSVEELQVVLVQPLYFSSSVLKLNYMKIYKTTANWVYYN